VACRAAIALKRDFAEAEVVMGRVSEGLGQYEDALTSYRRALEINPDYVQAHLYVGGVLRLLGRLEAAAASHRRVLALDANLAIAHNELGVVSHELGKMDDAVASYRRASQLSPDPDFDSNLLFCMSHIEADPAALFAGHRQFGERFEQPLRASWPQHSNDRNPKRCLNVGFVSGDFRDHAVAYFV